MREPIMATTTLSAARPPLLGRSIALMKPVTWFAPSWAFLCGAVASGAAHWTVQDVGKIALGTLFAGPISCGLSQVINDYCDCEVDAINEPQRLIPSGQVSTRQVFVTISVLVVLSFALALFLGQQVALLTAVGMLLSLAYSAEPIRAKRNGLIGNGLVGISYEGLPWLAGSLAFGALSTGSLAMALLFSLGAHGIMTLNDFKSIGGDTISGIRSIPVMYGEVAASYAAFITINLSQVLVAMYFIWQQQWWFVGIVGVLLLLQIPMQVKFFSIADPRARAVYYNASGIAMFVWVMLAAAIGVRG